MGFGGPYGLDYVAIAEVARSLEIEVGRVFWEKLKIFERAVLDALAKDQKADICDPEKCKFEFGEFFEWACGNCELRI